MRIVLDDIRPLRSDDPDFPVAIEAMRSAAATPILHGHRDRFWMVDASGDEPVDMVAVVDLTALGNMAAGSHGDWAERSKDIAIHRLNGEYAVRDVLESLVRVIRERRLAAEAGPRP